MKAAVLHEYGATPQVGEFTDPAGGPGTAVVHVAAAALHHADRLKASGSFYLSRPPLPSVVGSDGVGRLDDGRRVFFDATVAPYGSVAERALVPAGSVVDVPDGVSDVAAAALANTGLAAWLALSWRADLKHGETVLVLGATGALGSIAVQAARLLGAGRVVAADLAAALDRRPTHGADAVVALDPHATLVERLLDATAGGADVIVDPLWGPPALAAMQAAGHAARLIQLGQVAGMDLTLPAPVPRSKCLDIRGFAYVHAPQDARRAAYRELTAHVATGELVIDLETVALEDIARAWDRQAAGAGTKLVVDICSAP